MRTIHDFTNVAPALILKLSTTGPTSPTKNAALQFPETVLVAWDTGVLVSEGAEVVERPVTGVSVLVWTAGISVVVGDGFAAGVSGVAEGLEVDVAARPDTCVSIASRVCAATVPPEGAAVVAAPQAVARIRNRPVSKTVADF